MDKVAADPLASQLDLDSLRSRSRKILEASRRLAARAAELVAAVDEPSAPCRRGAARPNKREAFERARQLQRINRAMKEFERGFLGDEKGLRGREWYRHLGVAPGRWLGYGESRAIVHWAVLGISGSGLMEADGRARLAHT